MEEAGVKLIAQGANVYIGDLKSAESATNGFVDATEKGSRRIDGAAEIIIGGLRKIGSVAVEAFMEAGKAVVGFVGDSIGKAGDFEASMLEFQSVAGKDVDASGLEDFRDLFIDIGKRLPVSTSEVQQAAIEMVKGGIDPATIAAGGLEQNIQFAAAAMKGDLVKAAEISSKIMGGWTSITDSAADKSSFLTHATDLLAKAANASSTDVEGLSLGIFNAQGIAKTAGVSFDDLTTTLAALAPRFASSAEAGNSLKNMIARLQPTTKPATAAMEALGLFTEETGSAFYDAQGNFVGFETAAQLLQDSLRGLTKEQQAATLQQIFGNDAMGSAAALAELGAAGYQGMADALANANGVADAAALKQQGFNVALDNAKGSVEALQITIGSALLPILADLLNNYVSPVINAVSGLAESFFDAGGFSSEFGDSLVGLANALGLPGEAMQDTIFALQDIIGAFNEAGAGSSEFGESIGKLADTLGLPGELIEDIIFGIQNLIAAFGDSGAAAIDLGGAIDDLSGIWDKAIGVVEDVANGYMDVIDSVLPIVTRFVDEHGEEISAFFKTTYDTIIRIVNLALELYDAVVPKVLGNVASFIDEHATGIQAVISGAWDIITGVITGALALIEGIIKTSLALISGDWEGAWTAIQEMSVTFVLSLGQIIEGGLNAIAGMFNTSLAEIGRVWQNNWDMFISIVTRIADRMPEIGRSIVQGIQTGLANAWGSLMSWVTDKVGSLVDAALAAIDAGSPAVQWMPVGQFSVMGIMEGFRDAWPGLTKLVSTLGDDLIGQAKDLARNVQSAIADSFSASASIDRQIADNFDRILDTGDAFMQEYIQLSLNAEQKIAEAFTDPKTGAAYFKMVSDNIFETAELQERINEAQSQADKDRLHAQLVLISNAQRSEMNAFQAEQAGQDNPIESFAGAIQNLLGAKGLPGLMESDAMRQITALLTQLQQLANGMVSPPSSSARMATSSTTYNQQRQYTMPVYTNQSPTVLQDSLAIAGAMYP